MAASSAMNLFSLDNRQIIVTGANTGLGQGIAVALAQAGATVIGFARSSMADTAHKISESGGQFIEVHADLSHAKAAQTILDDCWQKYGPIDGLINNAGIIKRVDAVDFTEDDWDSVMDINLKTLFFLSQSFGRQVMKAERKGSIINIASMLSFQGGIRVASYTASKSGVLGVTRLLANEWAAKGINVNAIAPGYIETNNTQAIREDAKRSSDILARIPAGRWGKPADIGGTAVFLMSDAANYIHGAVIPVDGGWLAR
jgi:2-deoxy-D-gluconate 3-dehydrogenase